MPKSIRPGDDEMTRQQVIDALLQIDRARHDELGRTVGDGRSSQEPLLASPREQGAAPIDLQNVDE